jgi:hypothetical protein
LHDYKLLLFKLPAAAIKQSRRGAEGRLRGMRIDILNCGDLVDEPPGKTTPDPDSIPIRMTGIPTVVSPRICLPTFVVLESCGGKLPDDGWHRCKTRNVTAEMIPGAVAKLARYSWRDNPRTHRTPAISAGQMDPDRETAGASC